MIISNFRRIKEAHINLSDITVLAGKNNTGKSTISKCAYILVNANNKNDEQVIKDFKKVIISQSNLNYLKILKNESYQEKINLIEDILNKVNAASSIEEIKRELLNLNEIYNTGIFKDGSEFFIINQFIRELLPKLLLELDLVVKKGSQDYYKNHLTSEIFGAKNAPIYYKASSETKFDFTDESEKLVLKKAIYIQSSFYWAKKMTSQYSFLDDNQRVLAKEISDPDVLLTQLTKNKHKFDNMIEEKLSENNTNSFLSEISKIIEGDFSTERGKVVFTSVDNFKMEIFDMGSGLSSFALLILLAKNYHLDANTLLIYDEPEEHLHTQWQFEFAKALVLINQIYNTKILVNTHSPMIIESLKMHSSLYNRKIVFYLANFNKDKSVSIHDFTSRIDDIQNQLAEAFSKVDVTTLL